MGGLAGVAPGMMRAAIKMRYWALAAGLALALSPAWAQALRNYAPGNIDFALPDKWSAEARGQKLTMVNATEDAFVVFLMLKPESEPSFKIQIAKALTSQFEDVVLVDDGQKLTVDNVPALALRGTGNSDATPIAFRALVLMVKGRAPVMVLAYTTPANFPATDPSFVAVFDSLKVK